LRPDTAAAVVAADPGEARAVHPIPSLSSQIVTIRFTNNFLIIHRIEAQL